LESEKTREHYNYLLKKFANHYKLDSFDSILAIKGEELMKKIEDYTILFKEKGMSMSYIRSNTFALQSFCEANDKLDVNWKKLRKLCKKQKSRKSRPYTTSEIKRMLHSVKDLRNKALMLFLSSSGVRRGAIPVLKIGNLKQMPHGCVAITVYEGSDEEYITFINKEANDALTLYIEQRKHKGEIVTNDSPVFLGQSTNSSPKLKAMSEASVSTVMIRAKNNAGVNFEGAPNLLCHAFRRRFNTILKMNKESNSPLIERLMGHDMKLDNSYFQPTLDDLFAEYQKGMADLTIDDSERLLAERKSIEAQKSEIEVQKQEQNSMKEQMTILAENQAKMNHVMEMITRGDVTLVGKNNEKITLELI
jgi:integrase/recombinase XerD